MPTLAVIGDVHGDLARLDRVLDRITSQPPDGVLLVGDLGRGLGRTHRRTSRHLTRYRESKRAMLDRVRRLDLPFLFVPGNHDLPDLEDAENVDRRSMELCGMRVVGIGGAGPRSFGFAYEWTEDEIRSLVLPPADLLLCHCPPRGTALDRVCLFGMHAGSRAIRERAVGHEGFLVCGHIHESPGAEQLGRCLCLNAGGVGRLFGRPQLGFLRRHATGDEAWHEDLRSGRSRYWRRKS